MIERLLRVTCSYCHEKSIIMDEFLDPKAVLVQMGWVFFYSQHGQSEDIGCPDCDKKFKAVSARIELAKQITKASE